MPASLRPRLVCFYCGSRSNVVQDGTVRKWTCTVCDADNHLDENGDIADYVPEPSQENIQFAQSFSRESRAESPSQNIFCESCLKNQYIVNQALAAYLPATDDPKYDEYVESFPAYRDSLESRYPQVCEDCGPRVEEQLRRSSYTAKTDHLRRMMERTKGKPVVKQKGFDILKVLIKVGGLLWWLSIGCELIWHIGALLDLAKLDSVLGALDYSDASPVRRLAFSAHAYLHPWLDVIANLSVLLAVCSIWWHPLLSEKQSSPGIKLRRVDMHYRLAAVALLERLAGWWTLEHQGVVLSHQAQKGLHSFMLVFGFITTSALWQIVKIDFLPRGIFSEKTRASLGRGVQGAPSAGQDLNFTSSFPVGRLAQPAPKQNRPIDFGDTTDEDEMDWTPAQQPLQPMIRHISPAKQTAPRESPFTSALPAAPRSLNARLRNPNEPPRFVKASPETQQNFFRNSVGLSGTANGGGNSITQTSMAPQKLFTRADHQETGLEDIFVSSFTLKDDPLETMRVRKQRGQGPASSSFVGSAGPSVRRILTTSLALIFWTGAIWLGKGAGVVHFVLVNAVIAEQTLRSERFSGVTRLAPPAILNAIESVATVASLGVCAWTLINGNLESPVRDLSGAVCLAELFVHDFWEFITSSNQARGPVRRVSRISSTHNSNMHPRRQEQQQQPQQSQSGKGGMPSVTPLYPATALQQNTESSPDVSDSESVTFHALSKRPSGIKGGSGATVTSNTPRAPLVRYQATPESVVPSTRLKGLSLREESRESPVKRRSIRGGPVDSWGL